ncbi:MAG: hypothetical protein KDC44_00850, partial [Phaeodactylibacter sp.]|nr:hypothetical protein [Phaeodactylibacter sp.]
MNLNFTYRTDQSGKSWRLATLSLLLLGIAWLKFGHHELWKDEWQAWLMARDMSWRELLGSLYYEGHPALWYVYLKLWSLLQFVPDTVLIQSAHLLLVGAAFAVVLFRFGMPLWLKAAFLLGYYPLFEYGVVNRGYAWVLLLSFLLVEQLKKAAPKPWVLGGLFFLLCQTEVYGVLIGGGLFFYFWLEKGLKPALKNQGFWSGFAGMLLGLLVFVISVYPRASQEELESAYLSNPLSGESLGLAFQGTLANTYWLGSIPDTNVFGLSVLGLILSTLLLALFVVLFWPQKRSLWTFLVFQAVFFL